MTGFRGIEILILLGAFAIFSTIAITLDEGLTKSLEDVLHDNEFAISIKHVKLKKSDHTGKETLIAAKYPDPKTKFFIMLDHRNSRILLETVEDKKTGREDLEVGSLNVSQPMKSIILLIHQQKPDSRIDVYVDCNIQGAIPMKKTFKDIVERGADDLTLQVYRERKYRTRIHRSSEIFELWEKAGCRTRLEDVDHPGNYSATVSRVRRRGEIHRGDIPPLRTLDEINCVGDITLVKTLNELIEVTRRIWSELERNTQETRYIRKLIEECHACREEITTPAPPPVPRASCRHQSPCYPGAHCRDTDAGPECVACPHGYIGDGRHCRLRSCSDNPCFAGVRCQNSRGGFRCGSCPPGYTGNGEYCQRLRGCDAQPCDSAVTCHSLPEHPYYRCGACPEGYTGNGTNCQDIDECDLHQPCDSRSQCVNTTPGYRCESDGEFSN